MFEDLSVLQKHTQISHERHDEIARRGYDVITNTTFGPGERHQKQHQPHTTTNLTVWEKVEQDRLPLEQPPEAGRIGQADVQTWEISSARSARSQSVRSGTSSRRQAGSGTHRQPASARGRPSNVPPAPLSVTPRLD